MLFNKIYGIERTYSSGNISDKVSSGETQSPSIHGIWPHDESCSKIYLSVAYPTNIVRLRRMKTWNLENVGTCLTYMIRCLTQSIEF